MHILIAQVFFENADPQAVVSRSGLLGEVLAGENGRQLIDFSSFLGHVKQNFPAEKRGVDERAVPCHSGWSGTVAAQVVEPAGADGLNGSVFPRSLGRVFPRSWQGPIFFWGIGTLAFNPERSRYVATKRTLQQWSVEDSTELYGIRNWGAGYFGVSSKGEVEIYPSGKKTDIAVSVPEVIRGMRERGYDMPVLLRIENILDSQISLLHESFRKPSPRSATGASTVAFSRSRSISSNIRSKRSPSSGNGIITGLK